ncbi:hypothetical protein LB517_24580 [Mesorhizobium sp. BR1-1-12]|uniref:hypothetical protein n=1 Tax=unclassified Mesorhizobium TaxID=325217 RepID=UPI001CCDFCC0|nr:MULTISPECIES: hypothetical protein [unclassified Mesorhizobium]MBZ9920173.1 hypothetical protein [Mesorhizobium sp. BR1-1-7]MBZ9972813.1 hypothetical protein [Mesorhizobium sp. BR1-1-12]
MTGSVHSIVGLIARDLTEAVRDRSKELSRLDVESIASAWYNKKGGIVERLDLPHFWLC